MTFQFNGDFVRDHSCFQLRIGFEDQANQRLLRPEIVHIEIGISKSVHVILWVGVDPQGFRGDYSNEQ